MSRYKNKEKMGIWFTTALINTFHQQNVKCLVMVLVSIAVMYILASFFLAC